MIPMTKIFWGMLLPLCLIMWACESGSKKSTNDEEPGVDADSSVSDADGLVTDETIADEVATDEMLTDETTTDETTTDEALTDETVTDEIVTDEGITDEAITDESITDETATDETATDTEPDVIPDNDAPEEIFCDVIYRFYDGNTQLGRFHNVKTGTGSRNTLENAGKNASASNQSGPFDETTAWPGGYVRLRFTANATGTAPADDPAVQLIEYYMPIEFTVSTMGTNVTTNVDHSMGLLTLTTTGCIPEADACLPANNALTLNRTCTAVATGTVSGTTVTWDTCDVPDYPGASTSTSTTPSNAQMNWTTAKAQVNGDPADSPGCGHNMSSIGNVTCTGTFCGAVPADTLGVQNNTWDQVLPSFTFSSTAYESARVTIPEFIIPDKMSDVYSGINVNVGNGSAVASHMECGTLAELTCDEN